MPVRSARLVTPLPARVRRSFMMPEFGGIIFDFDGVIVESVEIKARAFGRMYEADGHDVVRAVLAHHHEQGGVSRRWKFIHFETQLLGRPLSEERLDALCGRYSELVVDEVIRCPFVPGAFDTLRELHGCVPLHLVSGTPDAELRAIVEARGLSGYFDSVQGAPTTKPDAFRAITRAAGGPDGWVAIGDSKTEYDAAMACGIEFIGVGPIAGLPPGTRTIATLEGGATCLRQLFSGPPRKA